TLRANRITGLRRYYGLIRPCATHRDLVLVGLPLGPSLGIVTTGSHVLPESPHHAHATLTPVTVKAVSRFRLDFIPGQRLEPGFDDIPTLSTPRQWFTCVRLLGSHLTSARLAFFRNAHDRDSESEPLPAIWNLVLQPGSEGPTLISHAAWWCRTLLRSSVHTFVAHVEWPGGVSPPGPRGSGREPRDSSGSYDPVAGRVPICQRSSRVESRASSLTSGIGSSHCWLTLARRVSLDAPPRFRQEFLPSLVDPSRRLNHSTPSLHPHYQVSTLLRVDPPLCHASGLGPCGSSTAAFPWHRDDRFPRSP